MAGSRQAAPPTLGGASHCRIDRVAERSVMCPLRSRVTEAVQTKRGEMQKRRAQKMFKKFSKCSWSPLALGLFLTGHPVRLSLSQTYNPMQLILLRWLQCHATSGGGGVICTGRFLVLRFQVIYQKVTTREVTPRTHSREPIRTPEKTEGNDFTSIRKLE